jgi:hypothetical protein
MWSVVTAVLTVLHVTAFHYIRIAIFHHLHFFTISLICYFESVCSRFLCNTYGLSSFSILLLLQISAHTGTSIE